jgi:hypothetical protein
MWSDNRCLLTITKDKRTIGKCLYSMHYSNGQEKATVSYFAVRTTSCLAWPRAKGDRRVIEHEVGGEVEKWRRSESEKQETQIRTDKCRGMGWNKIAG